MGELFVGLLLGAIIALSAVYALRGAGEITPESAADIPSVAQGGSDDRRAVTSSPTFEQASSVVRRR